MEKDIKKSHERYMDLIENSPEMIHQIDAERAFLHVNKTETERLGFTLEEMKSMKLEDLAPPERREELIPHFNRILSDGKSTLETTFRTKGGEDIEVEINETGFFDKNAGKLIQTRAFIRDISKRKEAQREIQFLNEYYETILGSMNAYVRVIKSNRTLEFENHLITKQFGRNVGRECNAFWNAGQHCDNCITNLTLASGKIQTSEEKTIDDRFYSLVSIPMKSRDGSISAIEVISDITVRKNLEQEIIQQEKMAGMGLLATGLAHEIGNPMGIVESAVQFCLQKLNPEGALKEHLEVIQRNISAADHTIKELLRFARPAENEPTEIDVIKLLEEACHIVASECMHRGIAVKEVYPEKIPYIFADRDNLQQVFVNILLNSIEAISAGGGITITLEADRAREKVKIAFADTGPGIPQEHLDQIFSPFFTTKEEGTGLGLSICHRVVEFQKGKLSAVNLAQGGAKITVTLPARWERTRSHEQYKHFSG
ncbi:MAG: ATP-binding protein [bacterium]